MKKYELMFVVGDSFSEPKAQEISKEVSSLVAKEGGKIETEIFWGKRKLAYQIADSAFGYYFIVVFSAEGKILEELTKELNLFERISRYLITEYLEGVELPDLEGKGHSQKTEEEHPARGAKRTGGEETARATTPVAKAPEVVSEVVEEEEKAPVAPEFVEDVAEEKEIVVESKEETEKAEGRKPATEEERKAELEKKLAEMLGDDATAGL